MKTIFRALLFLLTLAGALSIRPDAAFAAPLRICATVPELGSLAREIGGERVEVSVFTKGTEDPHYLDPKPSFVRALNGADLFLQVGMELEAGWVPPLLSNARNPRILPNGRGHLEASTVIFPLEVPTGAVDRSMGDIHPQGNPHYLADPLNGLKVAALIRDRLSELDPAGAPVYRSAYEDFRRRLGAALVGEPLSRKYDSEKLALLFRHGKLDSFLKQQGDAAHLGGWLGKMLPHRGTRIITYHRSWPYFAERFGLIVVDQLEPRPGIPPSPGHLVKVIGKARSEKVRLILLEPWLPTDSAELVSRKAGIPVVRAAVSTPGEKGGYRYLEGIDRTISRVAAALASSR